jgi:hypothetical protein
VQWFPLRPPRRLFAGAQWLHENPQRRQDPKAYGLIVEQIVKKGVNQFRSQGMPVADKAAVEADLTARARCCRELADLLSAALKEHQPAN